MLDPKNIPKFISQLPIPPVFTPRVIKDAKGQVCHEYKVDVSSFKQQLLPEGYPKTLVYGYGGFVRVGDQVNYVRTTPGPTFVATRGIPTRVKWINHLNERHFLPVDGTIHWANPNQEETEPKAYPIPFNPKKRAGLPQIQKPVPIVTHLHGGENPPPSDGDPEAWFTKDGKIKGQAFISDEYHYLNVQPATTLWYHDHTLGMTRLNVYAGLAGFYLLTDPTLPLNRYLPSGEFDIPLALQDRRFTEKGQLIEIENVGANPTIHPYWTGASFGNTNMVNGKVWPNLIVKRRQYRFRLLNGANGRFYRIALSYKKSNLPFVQIASDGGFLPQAVQLTELLISPGQRAEILVDFSKLPSGTKIVMKNDAPAPFSPTKAPLDPSDPTTDIMQFTVADSTPKHSLPLPKTLNTIPKLKPNATKRTLTLNEVPGPTGKPLMLLLNGQRWGAPVSETPLVGSTEDWEFVNITDDTHPMHLHLVQFQIISRQRFDKDRYKKDWLNLNGHPPFEKPTKTLPVKDYLVGSLIPPESNEQGWHDMVPAHPGQVTTIRVRFAPLLLEEGSVKPGENRYPFNPGARPGYVWHCHIVDHEDFEMMRPYKVIVPDHLPNQVGLSEREEEQSNQTSIADIKVNIYFNNRRNDKLRLDFI